MRGRGGTNLVQPVRPPVTLKVKGEPLPDGSDHGHDRVEPVLNLVVETQD